MIIGSVTRFLSILALTAVVSLAGACSDDTAADGTGGTGGSDADSGTGDTGGTGGGTPPPPPPSDAGATDNSPCPADSEFCTDDAKEAVCQTLVQCDLIPGPALDLDTCKAEITVECAECSIGSTLGDAGVPDAAPAVDCDTASANTECTDACGLLVQEPTSEAECVDIQSASETADEAYATCLCGMCLQEFTDCVTDDGCWKILQCAGRTGCRGMDCYNPMTCMAEVDEVGATSISTAMATEVGNCGAVCNM